MSLPSFIVTADQRMAAPSATKMVILGPSGIGKTSLAWTLDAGKTLVIDMESGMLALEGWQGDSIKVRDWQTMCNIACWLGGPNPARSENEMFSKAHYDAMVARYGDPAAALAKYDTIFVDSITHLSRLAFTWAKQQPQAISEKTGKPDTRGAYGLLKTEVIGLLSHLQHVPDKNVIFVGILDHHKDDYGRVTWQPQIEGSGSARELPGIVDEVISMVELEHEGKKYRAFVCQTLNQWGYPAKDRSGRLDMIEEPHLGKLLAKIKGGKRDNAMVTSLPENAGETPAADPPKESDPNEAPF